MIAEIHCHSKSTKLSYFPWFYDSVMTVDQIIETCLAKNILILAITDHDSLGGYWKAKKIIEDRKLNIILVPGMEISTKQGHVLGYGIEKEVGPNLSPEKTIDLIHKQGGIAIAAHPYLPFFSLNNKILELKFDAFEGYNSAATKSANVKSVNSANKMALPITAGSDAHSISGLGTGVMIFDDAKIKNWKDVIKAMRRGEFKTKIEYQNKLKIVCDSIRENVKL